MDTKLPCNPKIRWMAVYQWQYWGTPKKGWTYFNLYLLKAVKVP